MNTNDEMPSWLHEKTTADEVLAGASVSRDDEIQYSLHLPDWLKQPLSSSNSKPSSTTKKPIISQRKKKNKREKSDLYEDSSSNFCSDHPCRIFFWIFHFVSGLSGTVAFISNLAYVFYSGNGLRNGVIHFYAALFCLQIVAIELEVPFVVTRLRIMEWWLVRGLLYLFVGCLTVETGSIQHHLFLLVQNLSGILVSLVAVLYMAMGLCCVNSTTYEDHSNEKVPHYQSISNDAV